MGKAKKHLEHSHNQLTTGQLIRRWLESKLPTPKDSPIDPSITLNRPTPSNIEVNHIAIVLDGVVEEVLRAQNRLAALLLSNPEFVEFDPNEVYPQISTRYEDGKFIDADHNPNAQHDHDGDGHA